MSATLEAQEFEPRIANEPDVRLRDIIGALLEEHRAPAAACAALEVMAEEDRLLYRAIVNGHFHALCYEVVSRQFRSGRKSAWEAPEQIKSELLSAWADQVATGLMNDFVLRTGHKLGDATKEVLVTNANAYRAAAEDNAVKARFLDLVAKAMPAKGTVREKLTEQHLSALRSDAKLSRGAA